MTDTRSSIARETVGRLLAREKVPSEDPVAVVDALQRVWTRASESLRRCVGDDGYGALLVRAFTRSESDHPALKDIRLVDETSNTLAGVGAAVTRHGVSQVVAALEALLAALIDVLSGLIGADLVVNLLEDPGPRRATAEPPPPLAPSTRQPL